MTGSQRRGSESFDAGRPLIRPRQVDRVEEWLAEAVAGGGEAITGNRRLGDTTFAPTVILDPSADCRLSTQEIFGPAIAVYGYDDLDEAIGRANSLPTPSRRRASPTVSTSTCSACESSMRQR